MDYRTIGRENRNLSEYDRFIQKVEKTESCWIWLAYKNVLGYGSFKYDGNMRPAHRWSYKYHKGEIPDGLVIDHMCNNPSCVNPEHLQAITQEQNVARSASITNELKARTHCPQGHPYDEKNTYIRKNTTNGTRKCRACNAEYERKRRLTKTQA